MSDVVVKIENVKKKYKLGMIGGGTLRKDLQSWWARVRHKEDPNLKIGTNTANFGEEFLALDGINLEIKKGEAVGIIGHNGAGKSTLLKLLSRVTAPTDGTIKINGRIASMLEVGTGFHPELTGRENIYMNGAILGMTRKEVDSKIEEIIDFSECRQFIDTPVKRYSSGMYVKLAFSVAANLDSEIMIMDEVLAVGDMKFQKKCLDKMGVEAKGGKTVLYVSHNMATIRHLCTRCIVMDHGKVIFDGDVEKAIDIYSNSEEIEESVVYDLTDSERPSKEHGVDLRIDRFEFLEKKTPKYLAGEKMHFRLSMHSKADIDDLRLYFTIKNENDTVNIGTTESKPFASIKKGESITCDFELDISNLVTGRYMFFLDVFSLDQLGSHFSVDHPLKKIYFEVEDNRIDSIAWNTRYFGYVRMSPIVTVGRV